MTNQKLTLIQIIIKILQTNANQIFTANELANKILLNFPDWCAEKRQNSKQDLNSNQKLITQITAEIGIRVKEAMKRDDNLQTLEEKPRKFFYVSKNNTEELNESLTQDPSADLIDNFKLNRSKKLKIKNTDNPKKSELLEYELYPLLAQYLYTEYGIYSKRIDEKRSSNTYGAGGNKWLFPDIVALEIIGSNWQEDIRECAKEYSLPKGKLWSFEVKRKIDISNVREVFFQTVSNSSWANYSYLVTSKIIGSETIRELRILAGLHDIGVIQLDTTDPTESQILISASERNLDWNNANRLAEANKDFKEYIIDVNSIYRNPRSKERIIKNWILEK